MNVPGNRAVIGTLIQVSAALAVLAGGEPADVAFTAADGFWIHADFYRPTQGRQEATGGDVPVAVLIHDVGSDRKSWAPLIEPLRRAGVAVLAIDLRGHGASATTDTSERAARRDPAFFREMQGDLRGAYDWLANQGGIDRARFALIGAGAGAAVALRYAAKDTSVDVVICLSPPWDEPGVNPAGDMGQIHGRSILLVGAPEEKEICDALAARTTGAEVRISRNTGRGIGLVAGEPKLAKDVVDFAVRGMGEPTENHVCASIESNIYHLPSAAWVKQINPTNLRYYSSPAEAEARGLRAARSSGPDQQKGKNKGKRGPP